MTVGIVGSVIEPDSTPTPTKESADAVQRILGAAETQIRIDPRADDLGLHRHLEGSHELVDLRDGLFEAARVGTARLREV